MPLEETNPKERVKMLSVSQHDVIGYKLIYKRPGHYLIIKTNNLCQALFDKDHSPQHV